MNTSSSRSLQTIVFALIAVGLIMLALAGYLSPVSRLMLNPVVTIQTWITSRYQAIRDFVTVPQDMARLRQRNQELETEVSMLQRDIIQLQEQLSEASILSALVQFARQNPENRYQAAAVIARDPSPFLQYVIINQGSDHGLRRGMPVVTQDGLVGRIAAVTAGAARVQLITDPASVVNVRLDPSHAPGVLRGKLTGEISLDMIPQNVTLDENELVLTSGLGGSYPANIFVGQLSGVRQRESDLFQSASVQPAVDFTELELVLVIVNFRPVEVEPLIPDSEAP
jgi:rod shape-determining protein MreC